MTHRTDNLLRWLLAPLVALLATGAALPASAVEVGEMAPTFSLRGQDGAMHSLEDLRGETKALLIFFRGLW